MASRLNKRVTDEEFIKAVADSLSIRSALIKLGLAETGGAYKAFKNRCTSLGISNTHMTGQLWSKGRVLGVKYSIDDYLSNKRYISSHNLKERLVKEGIKQYICEWCKITEWRGQRIPLELDHIDGNHRNNSLDNLRILCPNCHSQTSNFRGKNKNKPSGPKGPSHEQQEYAIRHK